MTKFGDVWNESMKKKDPKIIDDFVHKHVELQKVSKEARKKANPSFETLEDMEKEAFRLMQKQFIKEFPKK